VAVRDYLGDIEAAVEAATRDVLNRGLATIVRTESGVKLRPRSQTACPLELFEIHGFGADGRPETLGLVLGEDGRLYREFYFAPGDDTLFDEHWLEFLNAVVSRHVPPVVEGRVEEEEIVRRADGKLLETRARFDIGDRVETYFLKYSWGSLMRRKSRSRRRCAPYAEGGEPPRPS
jgi:hypothetical protein